MASDAKDTFIYQADIYCADCGQKIRDRITAEGHAPADPADERSYDSSEFPKGPYGNGGGEADSPQHCAACRCPLGNALTSDGVRYVIEQLKDDLRDGRFNRITREWADLLADYGLTKAEERILKQYNAKFPAADLSKARLWLRMGDGGDYEQFGDDLDAVIDSIREYDPGRPLGNYTRGGIQTENFPSHNYISLFWGDDAADLVAELSSEEEAEVYRALDC